jgi:hypothetical protein
MGYTHYWRMTSPLKLSKTQEDLIGHILLDHDDILEVDEEAEKNVLSLNGIGDNSHETFWIERGKAEEFSFCKTARKPYDLPVCKLLLVLALSKGFTFSSDGDILDGEENWREAMAWFIARGYEDTLKKKILPALEKD